VGDSSALSLHPLVSGFTDAAAYDRGRPVYAVEFARALSRELRLPAGAQVLELGAGTGQLTRALLEAGLDVSAVEPLARMRELLERTISAERVRAGVAEAIPLADASVDAVFAADSFHWFDERRAMPEIRRVLRSGGGVAIARTMPELDLPWARELGELLLSARGEHPAFSERSPAAALEDDSAFGAVREINLAGARVISRAGIRTYLASMSWVATLDGQRRGGLLAASCSSETTSASSASGSTTRPGWRASARRGGACTRRAAREHAPQAPAAS
jgi:SAM-dependent methyltransferase